MHRAIPARRPSASTSTTAYAPSSRAHRSSDSHHAYAMSSASTITMIPQQPVHTANVPQQQVVQGLVKRLALKLPVHSGLPLDRLENDPLIEQTIETLVELSRDSLDLVAWTLAELTDRLAKQTDAATGNPPTIEILQSQLFILKVLALTMSSRWHPERTQLDQRSMSRSTDHTLVSDQHAPSIRSTWMEPAPMDDTCAKYILSVMVLFLRQTTKAEVPLMLDTNSTDLSFRDFELQDTLIFTGDPSLRPHSSATSLRSSILSSNSPRSYERTHLSLIQNAAAVNNLIAKHTGRIIFHISLKNWGVVYHRLRNKIRHLGSHPDDQPDHVDIQLMAHSMLDRQRLVNLLNDISSLLVNMGPEAQTAIAISLRTAVWNWIDRFPAEFNDAIRTRGRMDTAPERVFDLLYSSTQALASERIMWPCLTMLSCITHDRISADFLSQYAKRKDQRFGQELVRCMQQAHRLSETALACCVDYCRVAAFVDGTDEVPLRMMASDVAHEIKNTLYNRDSRKAFWETHDEIDVALYADALVAIFRFEPEGDAIAIFHSCMDPERSEAVKTAAIRACLTLLQDRERLPMQRSLAKLQAKVGHRLSEVMASAALRRPEVDQYNNMKRAASRPRGKRSYAEVLTDKELLILALLSMWRTSRWFFLKDIPDEQLDKWNMVTIKMWEAPLDVTVKVSSACAFYKYAEIALSTPPQDQAAVYTIETLRRHLPMTLQSVAACLLNTRTDLEAQHLCVSLCHSMIDVYSKKTDMEHVRLIQLDERRTPALTLAEIALMVSLTTSDVAVSHLAAKSLRLLSQVEQIPDGRSMGILGEDVLSKRNFVYEQLGDPRVVVVGRVGHQKRIRKLIRLISYSSPIHSAVWEECYSRWRAISRPVYEALDEEMNGNGAALRAAFGGQHQELRFQWQNLTLFLATLCGACTSEQGELHGLADAIPAEQLPDKIRAPQNIPALAETFITDLIVLLMHPDAFIRDTTREALGSELSPRFYPKLTRCMDEHMRRVEQTAGQKSKDETVMFLDQFIAVLKLIADNSHGPLEDVLGIDVSSLILSLAEFIARYDELASQRIKIKYCNLLTAVGTNFEILTIKRDNAIRHSLLDHVLDWLQPMNAQPTGGMDYKDHALSELNMACLRSAVRLLERLELRSPDTSNNTDETHHVASGLFKRYADRLLLCLDNYRLDIPTSDSTSEIGSISQRMRVSQKEAELRDLVITGLTHMVTANSESGFKQCLHLAYDHDNRKRTIFAHVFARVIGEGTTFEPTFKPSVPDRQTRFAELLRGSDMVLAMTICEICPPSEVETIISVLLNVFDSRNSLMALMKLMVEREVAQTDTESALFRSNSTCTRLLSAFARIHGYRYLRSIIHPLIRMIAKPLVNVALQEDHDPRNLRNDSRIDFVAGRLIQIIVCSRATFPPMLHEICAHIGKTVSDLWPESSFAALGAFIFLRFISPVIVSPETIDVEVPKDAEQDETTIRKTLMTIARRLQNLANIAFFGMNHTDAQDDFINNNVHLVSEFLQTLQETDTTPTVPVDEADDWTGNTPDDTDVIVLHRFFDKHADKIGKELLSLSKPSSDGDVSAVNGKRAWDGLCALLVDLGSPLEVPRPSLASSSHHLDFLDLMAEYGGRNTSRVRDLFVATDDASDTDLAYFVLRLCAMDTDDLDIKLLMCHVFKTVTSDAYVRRPFDIIVDCTSFSAMCELPLLWLKYCAEVVPSDIRSRFKTAYILNANYRAQKYLRRLYNVSAGTPFCSDIKTYASVELLLDSGVPEEVTTGLSYACSIEQENSEGEWRPVIMKIAHTRVSMHVILSSRHIRLTAMKASTISPGFTCHHVEIIPLTEVIDVYNITSTDPGQDQHEFVIRRRHESIYFAYPEREAIVKAIRSTKGKLKETPSPLTERFARFSNIPATLLHIGLLSVDPNDEELRSAAYSLLGSVCTYLKYDKAPIVARKAGFIPGDPFTFVVQMSEKIAEFAPQLTLDFIHEVSAAMSSMDKGAVSQRISCLQYLSPWIRNLAHFANPTNALFEKSGARLRDCVRTLADLSLNYPEIASTVQKCIWAEMSKLETFVTDVIFEELVRAAIDGGIGTRRCEVISQIVASMASISVRSRVQTKLRKALGKVLPSRHPAMSTLMSHHNWNEIATCIRIASVLGTTQNKQPGPNQLFVPELCHIITITAADGPSLVRKSVYGILMNLLQTLYVSRSEELSGPELLSLIETCSTSETLQLFGLTREHPTSEYTNWDPPSDRERLNQLDDLVRLLTTVTEVASGSRGLLNVWRARWMSLVTASAFQANPAVQTRSFVAVGVLATCDVDDDYIYQIMVALRTCFEKLTEGNRMTVVSILRCLCKLVPSLPHESRYPAVFFWLAVALLQSAQVAFFCEAANLLAVSLETMEEQNCFREASVSEILLDHRLHQEQDESQLDELLGISFETHFSLSLAHIIFKGMRHAFSRDAAEAALRSLLTINARVQSQFSERTYANVLSPDVLGYFLALLPVSTTTSTFRRLLKDCLIDETWHLDVGLPDEDNEDTAAPRINPEFLGIGDANAALLVATFAATTVCTAQGDDTETEMLYGLLSELATAFPEVINLIYDSLRQKIQDTFTSSSNAGAIRSATNIFRVWFSMQSECVRYESKSRSSSSTLDRVLDDKFATSPDHLDALEALNMLGLSWNLVFLPSNVATQEDANKVFQWIKDFVVFFQ